LVECDGFSHGGGGLVEAAEGSQQDAMVDVEEGIAGLGQERTPHQIESFGVAVGAEAEQAKQVQGLAVVRLAGENFAVDSLSGW
jgi:hypothetical protein